MNNSNHTYLNYTSPWAWAVPLVAIIGLVSVWTSGTNENLFLLLNSLGHSKAGTVFWGNITILGDTLIAFALLSPFVRQRPEVIWALLIAAVFATLWVHGLKPYFANPRPGAVLSSEIINIIGVKLHGGSFPSGHTTTAFVLAGVICGLRIHPLLSWTALLLATLAGISRAVVGAHWPMDIFAGAFGGWVTAVIGVMLYQRLAIYKQWEHHPPGRLFFNAGLLIIAITLFFYDNGYPISQFFQYGIAVMAIFVIAYNFSQMLRRQVSHQKQ